MNEIGCTSKQLVEQAIRGEKVPRVPTGPLAVHFCARLAGVSLREYTLNPRVLAECVLRYYERFRPDAVWISADTWVTAQAMGAAVAFPGEDQPMAGTGEPLVRARADIDRIPSPDPGSQGRCPLMLEALGRVVETLGREVFVVACFDQYPFSLACALAGMEQLMLALWDDRPLVEALLDRCAEYALAYGAALAGAGAAMLSGGDSPAGLLSPGLYREVALPWEQRVMAGLKSRTAAPISLHICGDASSILADMATSGANVLELDHQVDIAAASQAVGKNIALWGNLDPVGGLARGTPAQAAEKTAELLRAVDTAAHDRFVLSSGCTLALETPAANLQAALDTASRTRDGFSRAGLEVPRM
jgi:uroporphyrinogen decarboxylase